MHALQRGRRPLFPGGPGALPGTRCRLRHQIGVHRPTHGYVSTVPAVLSTRMGWEGIIKAQGDWTTSGFEF